MTAEITIWEQITGLVEDIPSVGLARVGRKLESSRQTDLVRDLGLVGDDAFEFMEKYASRLNVKKGDYDSSAYFNTEGLWLLPRFKKRKKDANYPWHA